MVAKLEVLHTEDQVQTEINRMAGEIVAVYGNSDIVVVGILRGCFYVAADLTRAIGKLRSEGRIFIEFVSSSSYGNGRTPGKVEVGPIKFSQPVTGAHILIVDEAIDSGGQIATIIGRVRRRKPASIRVAVLVDKKYEGVRPRSSQPSFVGFREAEGFLIGCGLDWDGSHRELPGVYRLLE